MKNAINWFEIPVLDFERARSFYGTIFEFEMPLDTVMGLQMAFFDSERTAVGGSIIAGEGYIPSHTGSVVYLNGGDDLNTVLHRVEAAGGKVLQPKTHLGDNAGNIAFFEDTEGNRVALHSMG